MNVSLFRRALGRLPLAGSALMLVLSLVLVASPPTYAAPRGGHGGPTNTPEVPLAGLLPLSLGVSTWLIYKKRSRSQPK